MATGIPPVSQGNPRLHLGGRTHHAAVTVHIFIVFCGAAMDLLHVYRLYRKMHQYPNLIGLMRSIFLDVLDQRGVVRRERLYTQALEEIRKDAAPDTETTRQ